MSEFKDKIKEFKMLKPEQIVPHPLNYKDHTEKQRAAFRSILGEVGVAGAVICYKLTTGKNKGKYQLIGGHMRHEELNQPIPALVVDVTPKQATELLARLDEVAELADTNDSVMAELLDTIDKCGDEFNAALKQLCPVQEPAFIPPAEDDDPGATLPAAAPFFEATTKQVPLVFTAKQREEFSSLAGKLNTKFSTDNYSDCVLQALKAGENANGKGKRKN